MTDMIASAASDGASASSSDLTIERDLEVRSLVAEQMLRIVFNTNVNRSVVMTEPPDTIPLITAQRIADNVHSWVATGDWHDRPLTDIEARDLDRADVPTLLAELDRTRAELKRYVGVEPTVADESAYLTRCLNAVREVCDQAEDQATRWENPLPVPEWVATVREAADGERPENPDDRRRRIYIDGKGGAWLDESVASDGTRWVAPLAGWMDGGSEPEATVRERTNGLHEIGRCF